MNKDIEVEVSGPLTKDKFKELVEFLGKNGRKIDEKHRVLIDYSTFLGDGLENRDKDIRLRITNGVPEIIVKLGRWGGENQRKELSVFAEHGSFDRLAQVFGELGYKRGMLCERISRVYDYKGVEFALVEVPGHSFHYEAEMMTEAGETEGTMEEIRKICAELGLEIWDDRGYFDYIEKLNIEANTIFDYDEYFEGDLEKKFGFEAKK